ncbi:MAG: PKD domain-containing protein [Bacteroidia bacterium]|nr:PKD domain-containing protein [Bacteroidia bacterium]
MKKLYLLFVVILLACLQIVNGQTVYWSEDFEGVIPNWYATNGTWDIGTPTVGGPSAAHGGIKCAGTVLDGTYNDGVNTKLRQINSITIPEVNQNPRLRFWHWFSFSSNDWGVVQISNDGGNNWTNMTNYNYYHTCSSIWTVEEIDLRPWAGMNILFAFQFNSAWSGTSWGWYIDDLEIRTGQYTFNNPEGFEAGYGDWSVEHGTWEIGQVTSGSGPGSCHSGVNCVGTLLNGNYDDDVDSRLRTTWFTVPHSNPGLSFYHWFSFSSNDWGSVQISTDGINWTTMSNNNFTSSSTNWTFYYQSLSAYADSLIQIAFRFHSAWSGTSSGLYIDDIAITSTVPVANFTGAPSVGNVPLTVQFTDQSINSPNSWSWDFGDGGTSTIQNPSHVYDSVGTYTVALTATNSYGSNTNTKNSYITVNPALDAAISPDPATVYVNTDLQLNGNPSGGSGIYSSHYWTGNTQYLNSTSIVNPVFNCPDVGNYALIYTVTDNLGYTSSDTIVVNVYSFIYEPEICIVTVDPVSGKNLIIWDKSQNSDIAYFRILREVSTGVYDSIGCVFAPEDCIFTDYLSTPVTQSYQYKIEAVKVNGDVSVRSPYHKTIHLSVSLGVPTTTVQLIWNKYEDESNDFTVSKYYIYRGPSPDNLQLCDSLSGTSDSYTDVNVTGVQYYAIGVTRAGGCNPTGSKDIDDGTSFSNIENNSTTTLSNDTTLQNLLYNGTSVPGFNPQTSDYNITLSTTIVPTVVGIPTHPNATVYVVNANGIPGTTTIVVTAENGINMKIYNLHFTYNSFIAENKIADALLQIYPNPFTNKTTIKFDNPYSKSYTLVITDITGKIVKEIKEIRTNKIEINRKELVNGIYTVELTCRHCVMAGKEGEKLFKGRIIIE